MRRIIKMGSPYCRGCIYRSGNNDDINICNYYLTTGIRRPCPAGKDCTVRKSKRKRKTNEEVDRKRDTNTTRKL